MDFLVFRKYTEKERVDILTNILREQNIEFEVTQDIENLDSLYGGNHFTKQFYIKIRNTDFERADALLLNHSEKELDAVDKDHYLYDFTDEELFDILSKPDEWNELDYQLSRRILKERGREINTDTIDLLKKKRITELAKPEEGNKRWVYAGYIFALFGGLIGAFIGWHLSTFKKTLPNGLRVYGHTEEDRKHGFWILIIGSIMFLVSMGIKFGNIK